MENYSTIVITSSFSNVDSSTLPVTYNILTTTDMYTKFAVNKDESVNSPTIHLNISNASNLNVRVNVSGQPRTLTANVNVSRTEHLPCTVNITGSKTLLTTFGITPFANAYGKFELIYPIRKTIKLYPKEDNYIDSIKKYDIYAKNENYIGNYQGSINRTLMKWDFSTLPVGEDIVYTDINFVFKPLYIDKEFQLEIKDINSTWSEYGTSWKGQPIDTTSLANLTLPNTRTYNRLDFMQVVSDWMSGTNHNNGILFKSLDESTETSYLRVGSKEYEPNSPYIEFQYYSKIDLNPEEYLEVNCKIATKDNNTLPVNFFVKGTRGETTLKANTYIIQKDTLNVELEINKGTLPVSFNIIGHSELDVSLNIPFINNTRYLDGNIVIHRPSLPVEVDISNTSTLMSNVEVHGLWNKTLNVNVKVREDVLLPIHAYIPPEPKTLNVNTIISGHKELPVDLIISDFEYLETNLNVSAYEELPIHSNVSAYEELPIHSNVAILEDFNIIVNSNVSAYEEFHID